MEKEAGGGGRYLSALCGEARKVGGDGIR